MIKYRKVGCTVFVMTNTQFFETCRRQYNLIKSSEQIQNPRIV